MIRNIKNFARKVIRLSGYDIQKIQRTPAALTEINTVPTPSGLTGIQYACSPKLLRNWVNVDFYPIDIMKKRYGMTTDYVYYQVDLRGRQPFPDNSFCHAFGEDFIEHLSQQDSILFLSECLRILRRGGCSG